MHTSELPSQPSSKHLKATIITAFAAALLPCLFLWGAYTEQHSPSWNPASDSGAAAGFVFIGISSVLAIGFVALAFPATAKFLYNRGRFSTSRFYRVLIAILALMSFVVGFVVSGWLGSFSEVFILGPLIFVIASLLSLPFASLWLKLAQ